MPRFRERMMDKNIFNISDVSDIPDACRKSLKGKNIRDDSQKLLSLFEMKEELSIDEIIVGMYRLFNIEKTRTWISSTLYNMGRKKLVKKSSKGRYVKNAPL